VVRKGEKDIRIKPIAVIDNSQTDELPQEAAA
jgi:hypothetical protein